MIGRTHRFHGRKAIGRVYESGRTVREPAINLRAATRGGGSPYRVAVVVSRKVSKSAVTRNRIRRRIYAVVGELAGQPDSVIRPGADLIFTVFDEKLARMPAGELGDTVAKLLQKAAQHR